MSADAVVLTATGARAWPPAELLFLAIDNAPPGTSATVPCRYSALLSRTPSRYKEPRRASLFPFLPVEHHSLPIAAAEHRRRVALSPATNPHFRHRQYLRPSLAQLVRTPDPAPDTSKPTSKLPATGRFFCRRRPQRRQPTPVSSDHPHLVR